MAEVMREAERLVGRYILAASFDSDGHLILRFEDGAACTIQGVGYDGLWTDVSIDIERLVAAK